MSIIEQSFYRACLSFDPGAFTSSMVSSNTSAYFSGARIIGNSIAASIALWTTSWISGWSRGISDSVCTVEISPYYIEKSPYLSIPKSSEL